MIRDNRNNFLSISSIELLKDNIISAGTYEGIQSYYSYPPKSRKITYSLKYFLTNQEIINIFNKITNFGYNINNHNLDIVIDGNITNISVGNIIYINKIEYFESTITLVQYPQYKNPEFEIESTLENQTKIIGYYINGRAFADSINNIAKIKKKKITINYSDINNIDYEVTPKSDFGKPGLNKYILSANGTNYKYIIDDKYNATLYLDLDITELL